jgi:hypothetical protein
VRTFFSYIIAVLVIQSTFLFRMIFESISGVINDRINDIFFIIALMSYVMMNFGISRSINKSFKMHVRQCQLKKYQDSINNGRNDYQNLKDSIFINESPEDDISTMDFKSIKKDRTYTLLSSG